jgi:hypothetical protein
MEKINSRNKTNRERGLRLPHPSLSLLCVCFLFGTLCWTALATARFDQTYQSRTVSASDWRLKEGSRLPQVVEIGALPVSQQHDILTKTEAIVGLFEGNGPLARPPAQCQQDEWSAQQRKKCLRRWESNIIRREKDTISRRENTLVVKQFDATITTLRDWKGCAPHGECDAEEFTYLGLLKQSHYHAIELAYGHDSPSLILLPVEKGPLFTVHYGSEATFLNTNQTLIVNTEDLNGPTSVVVTALQPTGPVIELQCLAARSPQESFAVQFRGWESDNVFAVVLQKNESPPPVDSGQAPQLFPLLFERTPEAFWRISSTDNLSTHGIECHQLHSLQ